MICPDCSHRVGVSVSMVGVEYPYGHPDRYDGVSEHYCPFCKLRLGRWSGRRLAAGETEPRWGGQQ